MKVNCDEENCAETSDERQTNNRVEDSLGQVWKFVGTVAQQLCKNDQVKGKLDQIDNMLDDLRRKDE